VEAERIARLLELRPAAKLLDVGARHARSRRRAGEVFGPDEFAERMKRQQGTIAALDAGFLRRELFVDRADPRRNSCIP
jgi:hypothetical protein